MTAESKQIFNIRGGVRANRDVVMGNQINTINVVEIQNQSQFIDALQKVQAQIDDIKKGQLIAAQVRNLAVAKDQIGVATAEAKKPQPLLK